MPRVPASGTQPAVPVAWTPNLPVWQETEGGVGQLLGWMGGRRASRWEPLQLRSRGRQGLADSVHGWPLLEGVGSVALETPASLGEEDLRVYGDREVVEMSLGAPCFSRPFTPHLSPAAPTAPQFSFSLGSEALGVSAPAPGPCPRPLPRAQQSRGWGPVEHGEPTTAHLGGSDSGPSWECPSGQKSRRNCVLGWKPSLQPSGAPTSFFRLQVV